MPSVDSKTGKNSVITEETARTSLASGASAATLAAARQVSEQIIQGKNIFGLRLLRFEHGPFPLKNETGIYGHQLEIGMPHGGLKDYQKAHLEVLCQAQSYWRGVVVETEVKGDRVVLSFTLTEESELRDHSGVMEGEGFISRLLKGKEYRACKAAGVILTEQGFKVREPVAATLSTLNKNYHGFALVVRFPEQAKSGEIGLDRAYAAWIPILADTCARDFHLNGEAIAQDGGASIFMTKDRDYVSQLFDPKPNIRLVVRRQRSLATMTEGIFFRTSTFRACRELAKKYSKGFDVVRKPVQLMGGTGHMVVLRYRALAGGKVIDDSYGASVRKMCDFLMQKYHVYAWIDHRPEIRCLAVTFSPPTSARPQQSGASLL
ncbi:MAG: hypothetical protein JSS72_03965 [Armatimonadetes bacterium]|nr:hypothetical protein [Armatimonadota bacterium]